MAQIEYKCPACGGAMEFDPVSQNLKCPFCDTEIAIKDYKAPESKKEQSGEGKRPDEYTGDKANVDSGSASQAVDNSGLYVYNCASCGGEIIAEENLASTTCPFCGNNVVMKDKFEGKLTPDYIIPFKTTKKDAIKAYKDFVGSKKLLPKIFIENNHIDKIRGVYVPFWLYNIKGEMDASFEATKVKQWRDGKYQNVETSYFDIHRQGTESFDYVPVDASANMPNDLSESLEPFDCTNMDKFNNGYLAGFIASKYDVPSEDTEERARSRVFRSMYEDFKDSINGYSSISDRGETHRVISQSRSYALYPIWLLNTTWEGKKYLFAMNGQTSKVVSDTLPMDKKRAVGYYFKYAAISVIVCVLISLFVYYVS